MSPFLKRTLSKNFGIFLSFFAGLNFAYAGQGLKYDRETIRQAMKDPLSYAPFNPQSPQAKEIMSRVTRGQLIAVDTRDAVACHKIHRDISRFRSAAGSITVEEMCHYEEKNPIVSIMVFQEVDSVEFHRRLNLSFLKSTENTLANDTRNLALTMIGAMGVLWLMPESSTGWDKEKIRNTDGGIFGSYVENVSDGPVKDGDDAFYNWVLHPVAGAAYYVMARHQGSSIMQSFGYSVLMSTFFWEFGFEAFAERPSIQDLIITPVIGSILGELFYNASQSIEERGGKLFGSRTLGKIAMVALNPMGALSDQINKAVGSKVIQESRTDVVMRRYKVLGSGDVYSSYIGLQVRFLFY